MKQIKYKFAIFVAVLAAGAVVIQAPYAAALTAHHAPVKCVTAEKDGRHVTHCTYRDTSTSTRSFRGGRIWVHNHTKVSVGISVAVPPAPPPVLPPLPEPPPVVPPQPELVEYTLHVFHAGVYQVPGNSLFTKTDMAPAGLTSADEIQSALGVPDEVILQKTGASEIVDRHVDGHTATLIVPGGVISQG